MIHKLIILFLITLYIFINLLFGKERVLLFDGSYALFHTLENCFSCFSHGRISILLVFIFNYILSTFKLPLNIIVGIQVMNYLLPIFILLSINKIYKKHIDFKILFVFIFSCVTFSTNTFYYPFHDYWTGFYLFFIFIWSIKYDKIFLSSFLVILITNTHITMYLPIYFYLLYYILIIKYINKSVKYSFIILLMLSCIKFLSIILLDSYDNSMIKSIQINLHTINFIESSIFKSFLDTLFSYNLPFFIFFTIFIIYLIYINKYFEILFLLIYIIISLILISIFHYNDTYHTYSEGFFKGLLFVLSIPIFHYINKENKTIILFSSYMYIIISIYIIYNNHTRYTDRYNKINELCKIANAKQSNVLFTTNKGICPLQQINLPYESYFINSIQNNCSNTVSLKVKEYNINEKIYCDFLKNKSLINKLIIIDADLLFSNIEDISVDKEKSSYTCIENSIYIN